MIKTYFTFMMISYFVQGEEIKTSILLPSYDSCSHSKAAFYERLNQAYGDDNVHLYCKGTDVMSKDYIKPLARP
tara:strand:+ start:1601 stop:1822 length:222 start_codon:yes stop_codon:yes gene_type:complete